jgi:hypothetical protein
MGARDFLHDQADSFVARALQLETGTEDVEPRLIKVYHELAGYLYQHLGVNAKVYAMPDLRLAPPDSATDLEQANMAYTDSKRFDPFDNETELLKQISLFQRKAETLAVDESAHRRAMHSIYLAIIGHCREALQQMRTTPIAD